MNKTLQDINRRLNSLNSLGLDVSHESKSLSDLGNRLQVLAINGIVLASKVSGDRGHSLVTLTSLISKLPNEINPILKNIRTDSMDLAKDVTNCKIRFKKFSQYSRAIDILLKGENHNSLDLKSLYSDNFTESQGLNPVISSLAKKSSIVYEIILMLLKDSDTRLFQLSHSIKTLNSLIKRIHYMNLSITIESSALKEEGKKFNGLIEKVSELMNFLEQHAKILIKDIESGFVLLEKINNRRIIV